MDLHAIWTATLGDLELSLSKANFTTWFKSTYIASYEQQKIVIAVPNTFTKSWLERKYHEAIVRSLRHVTSNAVREVTYRVEAKNTTVLPQLVEQFDVPDLAETTSNEPPTSYSVQTPRANESGLNPRYTFDNFVVGKANELAHAAAMAAAANPGKSYNPLFIYGDSGLGKTHLLHAIGHHLMKTINGARVRYVTCERFTNEFIQAVRSGHGKEFKETYRNVDILLMDDIQFLTGHEGTQEEFFHTYETLHQAEKQLVMTSDRCPKDIQGLEARLLSRFEWGMTCDVSSPDFETRVAILEAKAREKNLHLPDEILRYIAGVIQVNIRELEGALNKIVAYHQFKNTPVTLESVQLLLQSFAPHAPKRTISPRRLIEIIIKFYDLSMDEILGKSREQRLAFPRQIAMYLLREEAKCSFPSIGAHLGGRDHTTAMHACDKISDLLKTNTQLKRDISVLREHLYASGD